MKRTQRPPATTSPLCVRLIGRASCSRLPGQIVRTSAAPINARTAKPGNRPPSECPSATSRPRYRVLKAPGSRPDRRSIPNQSASSSGRSKPSDWWIVTYGASRGASARARAPAPSAPRPTRRQLSVLGSRSTRPSADRDQQEAIRERIVEGREALAPEREHQQEQVAPARVLQKAKPRPETYREEEAHLHDRAVEMLQAVRIEGEDHPGQQARDRAAGDRPRQDRGEEAAQAQGQEHEDVGGEESVAGGRHERHRQDPGHEHRLPVRLRVRVRVEEFRVEEVLRAHGGAGGPSTRSERPRWGGRHGPPAGARPGGARAGRCRRRWRRRRRGRPPGSGRAGARASPGRPGCAGRRPRRPRRLSS